MRFLTAGESHGKGFNGILEGVPSGFILDIPKIHNELDRRRKFYGRSSRMQIETDRVEFLSGLYNGITTGAPLAFFIKNSDNRFESADISLEAITKPRPGHADYGGMIKYSLNDARIIAERASGRETVARTVIGAIAKQILAAFSLTVQSHVTNIGGEKSSFSYYDVKIGKKSTNNNSNLFDSGEINLFADRDICRCLDIKASAKMKDIIDKAGERGDTVGGETEIIVKGMPAGFGSHVHFDRRLDYKISGLLMSIPSVKGLHIGCNDISNKSGSGVSDALMMSRGKVTRLNNNDGGMEGGISNGADIVVSLSVKPVPTMKIGAQTVDFLVGGTAALSHYERSDVCIVPAISVVSENMLAYAMADIITEQLGGDTMAEVSERFLRAKEKENVFGKN